MAVQMLYQSDLGRTDVVQVINSFRPVDYVLEDLEMEEGTVAPPARPSRNSSVEQAAAAFTYASSLVQGTLDHLDEIDTLIRKQAEHWRLERMLLKHHEFPGSLT